VCYLVGGFNPSEKYESQLGLLYPIYGKIIQIFQTTNQIYIEVAIIAIPQKDAKSVKPGW